MGEDNRESVSGVLADALGKMSSLYAEIISGCSKQRFDKQDKDGIERLLRKRRSRRGK